MRYRNPDAPGVPLAAPLSASDLMLATLRRRLDSVNQNVRFTDNHLGRSAR